MGDISILEKIISFPEGGEGFIELYLGRNIEGGLERRILPFRFHSRQIVSLSLETALHSSLALLLFSNKIIHKITKEMKRGKERNEEKKKRGKKEDEEEKKKVCGYT